ncbi:hypothetical protein BC829DRAFT_395666 [Chytridium lagenaria]|nr:hypothetical protein BC829DRAFT_395666 [Chytridium lagenaria]
MRITPQIIAELARMAEETNLFETMKTMHEEQMERESFLLAQRKLLLKKHEKKRDELMADEIIGRLTQSKTDALESQLHKELCQFDAFMGTEMTKLWKRHQGEMEKANVPLFRPTDVPGEVQMQRKVVALLVDMMPAGYLSPTPADT